MSFIAANLGSALDQLISSARDLLFVSPFVTSAGVRRCYPALARGATLRIICRLNDLDILTGVLEVPALKAAMQKGARIRFHDRKLHAKAWISEDAAVIGSANLTHGGLTSNLESALLVNKASDPARLRDIQNWANSSAWLRKIWWTPARIENRTTGQWQLERNVQPRRRQAVEGCLLSLRLRFRRFFFCVLRYV